MDRTTTGEVGGGEGEDLGCLRLHFDIEILFLETPLKLLKDVFDALQLFDFVDLLEKEKPRTLRPSLPLWAKIVMQMHLCN